MTYRGRHLLRHHVDYCETVSDCVVVPSVVHDAFVLFFFFFFNDTATTEIYTLSLHDALPISAPPSGSARWCDSCHTPAGRCRSSPSTKHTARSEEHTSELQSLAYLVCRLLLEKKKNVKYSTATR